MKPHEFRTMAEQHQEAVKQAKEHMDSLGIPEDSLLRPMADFQLACNANPPLSFLMHEMYSTPLALMS